MPDATAGDYPDTRCRPVLARSGTMRLPNPYLTPLVTVPAAGALLGVSQRTAYRAAAAGHIPTVTVAGGRWVPVAELYRILAIPLPASPAMPVIDH